MKKQLSLIVTCSALLGAAVYLLNQTPSAGVLSQSQPLVIIKDQNTVDRESTMPPIQEFEPIPAGPDVLHEPAAITNDPDIIRSSKDPATRAFLSKFKKWSDIGNPKGQTN
jgi:hypothetical protein